MGFIHKYKSSDEDIVLFSRHHWVVFLSPCLWTVLFLLLCYSQSMDPVFYLISTIYLLWSVIKYFNIEFSVTNKRLLSKEGVISRKTHETSLGKLESVSVEQSITGRMLGYGSVVIFGTGGTPEYIRFIPHPFKFRDPATHAVEHYRKN